MPSWLPQGTLVWLSCTALPKDNTSGAENTVRFLEIWSFISLCVHGIVLCVSRVSGNRPRWMAVASANVASVDPRRCHGQNSSPGDAVVGLTWSFASCVALGRMPYPLTLIFSLCWAGGLNLTISGRPPASSNMWQSQDPRRWLHRGTTHTIFLLNFNNGFSMTLRTNTNLQFSLLIR